MSIVSQGISLAKKIKHSAEDRIKARKKVYVSPVRRIDGVKLSDRICAMTFDDGPTRAAANPGNGSGLTMSLLQTLEKYGARGTFDCIGDTSGNYPDECGKEGTAMWGGTAYDHYPDFERDNEAGIANCPELVDRILRGGHEITNHSYVHRIWGAKPLVYGKRAYMGDFGAVIDDLERFDKLMKGTHGYAVKMGRPPHYVDNICDGLTSYDAYAALGYQYLGAGPDGGGWLPGKDYESEVKAMIDAVEGPLSENGEAFCGAIIFQKDGCNMMRRTPVADALPRQLEILQQYGYRVVTVSHLMSISSFSDVGPGEPGFRAAMTMLEKGMCPAFSDNCLHLDRAVSPEETAMMIFGWEAAKRRAFDMANLPLTYEMNDFSGEMRISRIPSAKASKMSPYDYAMMIADSHGIDTGKISNGKSRLELLELLAGTEF